MGFLNRNRNAATAPVSPAPAAGPTAFAPAGPAGAERATFAAGCFWGIEAAFREIEGVVQTAVGYTGGSTTAPSYKQVCRGTTGHAEAVEVYFDPARVGYGELLDVFWRIHNPTTANRQGLDIGSQYRSAIFTHSAEQQDTASASLEREQAAKRRRIVTQLASASAFYRAEEYHQRYFEKSDRSACATSVGVAPAASAA